MRETTETPKQAGNRGKGRKKGVPNRATASIRDIAQQYTAEAIEALVKVLREETGAPRVAAANAILDRGYGKPSQALTGEGGGPIHIKAERAEWIIVDAPTQGGA